MYLFERVLRAIQVRMRRKRKANFTLDVDTLRSLKVLAERESRTPEDIANQFLNDALHSHQNQGVYWQIWQELTPREQEVAALICLGYTTRQVALKLHISPETVKTHVTHVLLKYNVADRHQLRQLLIGWDFSGWDLE